jgi:aminopeptidase N
MWIHRKLLVVFITIWVITSCGTKKDITYQGPDGYLEEEMLDTLVISDVADLMDSLPKIFKPTATLTYDILHTKLDLKFDWANQHVKGKANLTIAPYFKTINTIILDAVGFEIHKIILQQPSVKELNFTYDGTKLNITLDKFYTKNEIFDIFIEYTAKPNENPLSTGDAITSDKGLFFIDPLDKDPDVPTQIWTQGETENNSRWFPTFDKPNERFTQEITLTVEDKYLTLSNGRKIMSRKNDDGTRTDHWKQDKPHAPYLAMIAVGEFHEEMDEWNKIPLHYIVEKGFGKHAKKIFNHTPEMLSFFSDKLKYPYPWDKYGQIVVRDFVSGAMENTGAVVFGEQVQKTERELIDNDNDYIVAHEMMHHWFGDLVTCEDWSNLTLNEGFANYAEYLWFEHKYGRDRAEFHRMNEMNGYYGQVFGGDAHPLIHYYYDEKEQMFDAHSYNKGGLVLHMLRNYLGDDGFFAGLNKYLADNAHSAVEVDELRMAFEDTVGEDLHWFFDQWFLGNGHPHINVQYTYNQDNKVLLIETDLSDTPADFYPNFRLPVDVAVYYADGSVTYHPILIDENKNRFLLEDLKADPVTYVFDGRNVLLAMVNENKTAEQYRKQFLLSPNFMDKMIGFTSTNDGNESLISPAMKDKFYLFRSMGISTIPDSLAYQYVDQLQEMALSDPHSEVRKEALIKLLNIEDFDPKSLCRLIINAERAYPVLQVALEVMGQIEEDKKEEYIKKFKNEDSDFLAATLVGMMNTPTEENLNYLESKAASININYIFEYFSRYQEFLLGKDMDILERSATFLNKIASAKDGNMFRKYLAMTSLLKIAEDLSKTKETSDNPNIASLLKKVALMISSIAKNETNPTLIEKYEGIR